MKSFLATSLFFLFSISGFSQETNAKQLTLSPNDYLILYDSLGKETKSKDFEHFKIIKDYKLMKPLYTVLEYYRSGVMKSEFKSKTNDGFKIDGQVVNYYKNGNKKSLSSFSDGMLDGKVFEWYENGARKKEVEFFKDEKKEYKRYKILQFWNEAGEKIVADGNGFFDDKKENGTLVNGLKDGEWNGTIDKLVYKENYKEGKFISGESVDSNNKKYIYKVLEEKPYYSGGMDNFYRCIGNSYNMSKLPSGLRGKVVVSFVIGTDGKIIEPKIIKDLGFGSGDEAIRILLNNCGNWTPGIQKGRAVRCSYTLPITIENPY